MLWNLYPRTLVNVCQSQGIINSGAHPSRTRLLISPSCVAKDESRAEATGGNMDPVDNHDWALPPQVVPIVDTPGGGRQGLFCRNRIGMEDTYAFNILRYGYCLSLTMALEQGLYLRIQHQLLGTNIQTLLEKSAIEVVQTPVQLPGFYSPIFLIPKQDSNKMWMIHSLTTP